MQLNYRAMSSDDVYPAIQEWQDKIDGQMEELTGATMEHVSTWQVELQEMIVESWWQLGDWLIMKYNDGKTNWPKAGVSWGYPEWYAQMIGFGNDVRPIWVQPAEAPAVVVPGYVPKTVQLPLFWNNYGAHDFHSGTWTQSLPSMFAEFPSSHRALFVQLFMACVVFLAGVSFGRSSGRRQISITESTRPLL